VATTRHIARTVALRTGLPLERVQETAYALKEAGAMNTCSEAIANLILALAADASPKSAVSVARHYAALTDDDYAKPAGEMLGDMVSAFLEQSRTPFSQWAYQSQIEVYSGTPAIRIHMPGFEINYIESHDPDAWQAATVRRCTVISGEALYNIARDLLLTATVQHV
jgi:hypothetical protein